VTPGSPRRVQALAAFIAAPLLTWALAKGVGASGLHPGLSLGLIATAATAAALLRRSPSATPSDTLSQRALSRVALSRVAWVSAVLLLYGHLVRVPVSMLRMGLLMLAGVVLGAALLKRLRLDDAAQAPHRVALNLFAVAASGWMTLTWSFQHLEWAQAYDWFGAAFVEDRVVLFVPLIALKYTLPVMLCRWLLQETLGPEPLTTRRWLWTAASLKALAALMVSLGFAVCLPNTSIYLESVQQAAVFVIASLGLAVGAGRVRAEANPDAALMR
jgi:hypothetical protein